MQTALQELEEWCIANAFNIEGQDGTKYLAIDYEEMRQLFDNLLAQEKQQIADAYTKGELVVAEIFIKRYNNSLYNRILGRKIKLPKNDFDDGREYYSQTYK
jgi:broad-specificity NMP kinase